MNMSFILQTVKNGKDTILFNNNKFRESYAVKNGDVVWRCLGRSCKASIRTDKEKTAIYFSNENHSGPHPVTMRVLTPSPQQGRRTSPYATPVADTPVADTPPSTTSVSTPAPSPLPAEDCITPSVSITSHSATPAPTNAPTDPANEIASLKKEIERLKDELRAVLDHTIESDTRLLQFTDEIFVANTLNNKTSASVTIERGVQCELGDSEEPSTNSASADSRLQCGETNQQSAASTFPNTDFNDIISSMKTTIEVLTAENQCLKLKLEERESLEPYTECLWTEVRNKKHKSQARNHLHQQQPTKKQQSLEKTAHGRFSQVKHGKLDLMNPIPPKYSSNATPTKTKQKHTKLKVFFDNVTILGDSHARHLAGLVGGLVDSSTTVFGSCKPGAKFLDIAHPGEHSSVPSTKAGCEVLLAGTNDLATGTHHNLYNNLEKYVTHRPTGTKLVVTTLPYRHDIRDPRHPVHEETRLVNAYIEELAIKRDFYVLNTGRIPRRHFTGHGQHLNMMGKRLLARMLVRILCAASCRPTASRDARRTLMTPSFRAVTRPGHGTFAETAGRALTSPTFSAVTRPGHRTFAEAVMRPSTKENIVYNHKTFLGPPPSNIGLK